MENAPKVCVARIKLSPNFRPSLNIFWRMAFFIERFWNSSKPMIRSFVVAASFVYWELLHIDANTSSARAVCVSISISEKSIYNKDVDRGVIICQRGHLKTFLFALHTIHHLEILKNKYKRLECKSNLKIECCIWIIN